MICKGCKAAITAHLVVRDFRWFAHEAKAAAHLEDVVISLACLIEEDEWLPPLISNGHVAEFTNLKSVMDLDGFYYAGQTREDEDLACCCRSNGKEELPNFEEMLPEVSDLECIADGGSGAAGFKGCHKCQKEMLDLSQKNERRHAASCRTTRRKMPDLEDGVVGLTTVA
ncbi:hypothetical protein ACLOJK_037185 [Asimina triloba]